MISLLSLCNHSHEYLKVRQSDCLRAWGRDLGYTLAVTSVYQKLNNLPQRLGEHSRRYSTALVQTFWHMGLPVGFCGGSFLLQLQQVFAQLSLIHNVSQARSASVPMVCLLPQSPSSLYLSTLICSCLAFAVSSKSDMH